MLNIIGYTLLALWIWEYIGIRVRKQLNCGFLSPTTIINLLTHYAKICFNHIGRLIALISSFYVYLRLEDFFYAGWDLLRSTWNLLLSGFEMMHGYFATSLTFKRSYLIYIGTSTIGAAIIVGIYYWFGLDYMDRYNQGMTIAIAGLVGLLFIFGLGEYKPTQSK